MITSHNTPGRWFLRKGEYVIHPDRAKRMEGVQEALDKTNEGGVESDEVSDEVAGVEEDV